MKAHETLLALIILAFFPAALSAQDEWSLEKCIKYAQENNLNIKQQKLSLRESRNNVLQSKMDFLPSLSASGSHNFSWGRSVNLNDLTIIKNKLTQSSSVNLSSSVDIFNGFSKINKLKSNKTQLEISEQEIEKTKNSITIAITKSYLQVLLAEEIEKNNKENLISITRQVERTKKFVDAGKQAYSSFLEIQAQLATEKVQLVTADNDVRTNYLTLKQLLDIPDSMVFHIENPVIKESSEIRTEDGIRNIYNSALSLPRIKSAELSLKKSETDLKAVKGTAYPSISVSAGYGTYYSDSQQGSLLHQFDNNRNPSIGLSLNIPVFRNLSIHTNIKNSELAVENYKIELRKEKQDLYKEIQSAYNDAVSYYNKLAAAQENLKSSERSFRDVENKYNVGAVDVTDYIIARTKLFNAQSDYSQTKFQYFFQLKILDFYRGIPIKL
ncbi:MAG: TolC family protein [Bacteroidales bacterium]|jgi:outer membrane protein|nr:TolC family protein [Bacteroidales bacterium]